ncbi:nitroreductase family protein [Yinghuangia sp. YIM S09857]|uniref:nitroreductase family protein n=1 Tax=Yinghuangia sp. YIM S09857 TaxID=3436929 RepID=UPI003F52B032
MTNQSPVTGLTAEEVLTTTRTVRRRLDLGRPVEREVVEDCLRIAFQAPNGSNVQSYRWIVVDDPATRRAMAEVYRAALGDQLAASERARAAGARSVYPTGAAQDRISRSVTHLVDHMHEVPVLVVPTFTGRFDAAGMFDQASAWGSVLPAVWNFMLALRTRGLGSAWTTLHLHREREMAEVLGIPHEHTTQAGLFPVAYTLGTDFRPGPRADLERLVHWNRWPNEDRPEAVAFGHKEG